jgi:hypothetical protein
MYLKVNKKLNNLLSSQPIIREPARQSKNPQKFHAENHLGRFQIVRLLLVD